MGAQQVVNSVNIIAISHQHHHHHHYSDHHHHVDHLHHQHDHHLQVAAILRSAGQECIRLVVARPIDPADIHQPVFVFLLLSNVIVIVIVIIIKIIILIFTIATSFSS